MVTYSPLSTLGALALASSRDEQNKQSCSTDACYRVYWGHSGGLLGYSGFTTCSNWVGWAGHVDPPRDTSNSNRLSQTSPRTWFLGSFFVRTLITFSLPGLSYPPWPSWLWRTQASLPVICSMSIAMINARSHASILCCFSSSAGLLSTSLPKP